MNKKYIDWVNNELKKIPIYTHNRDKNFTLKHILSKNTLSNYNALEFKVNRILNHSMDNKNNIIN